MESNHQYIIIFLLVISLLMVYHYYFGYKKPCGCTEHMSNVNKEALETLASMFKDGILKVTKLEVTDDIKCKSLNATADITATEGMIGKYFKLSGATISHNDAKADGILYRSGGQFFIGTDDNIYFRDNGRNKQIHFEVHNEKIRAKDIDVTNHISAHNIDARSHKLLKNNQRVTIRSGRTGRRLNDSDRNAQFYNHNRASHETMYLEIL